MNYRIKQKTEFCTGCGVCQMACKDKNNLPVGVNYRKIVTRETGSFPNVKVVNVSVKLDGCDLCSDLLAKGENPACVDACPLHLLYVEHN